jgi:hypothetical protein
MIRVAVFTERRKQCFEEHASDMLPGTTGRNPKPAKNFVTLWEVATKRWNKVGKKYLYIQ